MGVGRGVKGAGGVTLGGGASGWGGGIKLNGKSEFIKLCILSFQGE